MSNERSPRRKTWWILIAVAVAAVVVLARPPLPKRDEPQPPAPPTPVETVPDQKPLPIPEPGTAPVQLEQTRERFKEQAERDRAAYGDDILRIFSEAMPPGRADTDRAFVEMQRKYPKAELTGVLIGERALQCARRGSTGEVEGLLQQLTEIPGHETLVNDKGIEMYPALLFFMCNATANSDVAKCQQYAERLAGLSCTEVAVPGGAGGIQYMDKMQLLNKLRNRPPQ